MEQHINQTYICKQCNNTITHVILKAYMFDKCLKCVTNDKLNLVHKNLLETYSRIRFNQKQATNCGKCKLNKVVSDCVYANIYQNTNKEKIIPKYGDSVCLQCIIELANDMNEFISYDS